MNRKKNYIFYIGVVAVLIFAGACSIRTGGGRITIPPTATTAPTATTVPIATEIPAATITPTETSDITPSPAASLAPEPTKNPEPTPSNVPTPTPASVLTPTVSATPTVTPEALPSPEASATPTPTKKPETVPTQVPEPTETPVPTITPTLTPTPSPTIAPSPTITPPPTIIPSPTPTLTPTPTPALNPLNLVHAGWQSMQDITMDHYIVFPECFDDSTIEKNAPILSFVYTSSKDETILFSVIYTIGQTYEAAVEEVYAREGLIEEHVPEERSFSYLLEEGETVFRGWVIEEYYSAKLLGSQYDKQEITGTMRVVFSYPIAVREQYETEAFRYYVVRDE
ncbi:MAG: hypothetical protein ACI4FZ_08965 [Lachnospiraceae bacterium]